MKGGKEITDEMTDKKGGEESEPGEVIDGAGIRD